VINTLAGVLVLSADVFEANAIRFSSSVGTTRACHRDRDRPRDELLEAICRGLGMAEDSPASIVSPSMSGSFSVPLLLRKPVRYDKGLWRRRVDDEA